MSPAPTRLTIALQALDYPPDLFVSSIGLYTSALAGALARRGHRVHVLSRGGKDPGMGLEDSAPEGTAHGGRVTVHRLSSAPSHYLETISVRAALELFASVAPAEWRYRRQVAAKLAELIEAEGVELIEVADASVEAVLYKPQAFAHVPFVVRLHGPMIALDRFDRYIPKIGRPIIRWAERQLAAKATHLSAPSRAAERLFREELELGDREITVYPNMPTLDLIEPAPPEAADPNLVLYVGRHIPVKGVHLLVNAIPAVLAKRPETRFVFVGPDGPTNQAYTSSQGYLMSLLPERYHHAVTFTGYKPLEELSSFYRRAAVCVIPSLFESFGYTCLEAMMHGKAIIATPTGDMAEMLDGGRCGLIYTPPAGSVASPTANGPVGPSGKLSNHILELLASPNRRERLGRAARERAVSCYRTDLIAARVESFYYRAIAEQRAPQPELAAVRSPQKL